MKPEYVSSKSSQKPVPPVYPVVVKTDLTEKVEITEDNLPSVNEADDLYQRLSIRGGGEFASRAIFLPEQFSEGGYIHWQVCREPNGTLVLLPLRNPLN